MRYAWEPKRLGHSETAAISKLGEQATRRLTRLGYKNVDVRVGDGYYGWREAAPFDVIVVTAVAGHIPPPLLERLIVGALRHADLTITTGATRLPGTTMAHATRRCAMACRCLIPGAIVLALAMLGLAPPSRAAPGDVDLVTIGYGGAAVGGGRTAVSTASDPRTVNENSPRIGCPSALAVCQRTV